MRGDWKTTTSNVKSHPGPSYFRGVSAFRSLYCLANHVRDIQPSLARNTILHSFFPSCSRCKVKARPESVRKFAKMAEVHEPVMLESIAPEPQLNGEELPVDARETPSKYFFHSRSTIQAGDVVIVYQVSTRSQYVWFFPHCPSRLATASAH